MGVLRKAPTDLSRTIKGGAIVRDDATPLPPPPTRTMPPPVPRDVSSTIEMRRMDPPETREDVAMALHSAAYQLAQGYDTEVVALIREPGRGVVAAVWPPHASGRLTAAVLRLAADLIHDGSEDSEPLT